MPGPNRFAGRFALPLLAALLGEDPDRLHAGETAACCLPSAGPTCIEASVSGCVDAGGVWQGAATVCGGITCVAAPPCPPGSVNESGGAGPPGGEPGCGQPAPDSFNSGCAVSMPAFTFLSNDACPMPVCGQSSADLRTGTAGRDTDYFYLLPSETTQYTFCVDAPFHPEVSLWELSAGVDPCDAITLQESAFGAPGSNVCLVACLLRSNPHAVRVTTVDANGDPQRDGIGCVNYRLTTTCADCVAGACCVGPTCVVGTFPFGNSYAGEVVSRVNCEAQQGFYLGDGATCIGAQCESACCLPNGTCSYTPRQICLDQGGMWHLNAVCVDVEPCPLCTGEDPNDLDGAEGAEEACSTLETDVVNSGCTAGAPGTLFSPITCNQTVCASTAFEGGLRDVDWYHFVVPGAVEMMFTVNNNTAHVLRFAVRWYPQQAGLPACNPIGVFDLLPPPLDSVPAGESAVFPFALGAGRYTLIATYDFRDSSGTPVPCPGPYRITAACSASPCQVVRHCQSNENEPNCGVPVNLNSGCSTGEVAGARTTLPLNTRMCGDTFVLRENGPPATLVSDADAFLFRIVLPDTYTIRFEAEFNALVRVRRISDTGRCDDPDVIQWRVPQCGLIPYSSAYNGTNLDTPVLTVGDYELLVAPDLGAYGGALIGSDTDPPAGPAPGTQEFCPARYEIEVNLYEPPWPLCGDSNLNGVISVGDIPYFVAAVAQGFAAWEAMLPGAQTFSQFIVANDTTLNGSITVNDIPRFVNSVVAGSSQCAP